MISTDTSCRLLRRLLPHLWVRQPVLLIIADSATPGVIAHKSARAAWEGPHVDTREDVRTRVLPGALRPARRAQGTSRAPLPSLSRAKQVAGGSRQRLLHHLPSTVYRLPSAAPQIATACSDKPEQNTHILCFGHEHKTSWQCIQYPVLFPSLLRAAFPDVLSPVAFFSQCLKIFMEATEFRVLRLCPCEIPLGGHQVTRAMLRYR